MTMRRPNHSTSRTRLLLTVLASLLACAVTAVPTFATVGEKPTARLTISPSPATAGEHATLDASGSTPDSGGSAITLYYWDFDGDGIHERETANPVISHAFAAGEHRVRVAVEDAEHDWSEVFVNLTVTEKPAQPSEPTPGAWDTSLYSPWWRLPDTWLVHEFKMPNVSPRARGRRSVRFTSLKTARARLAKVLEKSGASVRIVEKHESLPKSYRDERYIKRAKWPVVLGQKPAPGTTVRTSLGRGEQSVAISYWDPAKDPLVKKEIKQEIREDKGTKKAKNPCKLVSVPNLDMRRLLLAKRLVDAVKVAKGYGCTRWEAGFSYNTRIFNDIVQDVAITKDGMLKYKVVLPKQPDFVMTFREDPARLKSPHDLSLVATPGGDWVLPKSNLSVSRMTIQVNELATGRFVARASGVQIEIYNESTGKLLVRTKSDANGEAAFQFKLPQETSLLIGAVLKRGSETMQAWRNVRVKDLGRSFTTVCGRRIALKKVNGKNVYRGNQSELYRCKGLPIVPGNLGTGKGASNPRVPAVEERPALGLTAQGTPELVTGMHNAIEVAGENTIVGAAPGIIAAGGGNIIATGGLNRALARGAGGVRANAAFFGPVGSLLQAIVAPLRKAWDDGVSNVRKMLPVAKANDLARTRDALQSAGIPAGSPGELVPEKVGIIAAGGGNIIATGGGNIIAAGGGNIIAPGGGNLISDKGIGIIAAGGGNIIATGGGNVMPVYGGRLIGHAGGN